MPFSAEEIINLFERSDMEALQAHGGITGFAAEFRTDLQNGIPENDDLDRRREEFGVNQLPDIKKTTWCGFFIECFQDLMLIILLVSAFVSLILQTIFPDDGVRKFENYIDIISIYVTVLLVAIVNAQVNYAQQKAFLEVSKLKNTFPVNVIRFGQEMQIMNNELLVGDIMNLKNGDRVAADGLFISGHSMKLNNSQETGESVAVSINEKMPFVLGNAAVESGDGKVLVCAVGVNSQSGNTMKKIQDMSETPQQSPLEKKLDKLAVKLTYIGLSGALLTFLILLIFWIVDWVKNGYRGSLWNDLVRRFMIGVAIFICAVPEGLPLAVTLSLGFSMKRMMRDNNFVRHLSACETMGGATTICSDKTGTLTQNKMTVVKSYVVDQEYDENPQFSDSIRNLLEEAIAINTSAFQTPEGEFIGPSSEVALLQLILKSGFDIKKCRDEHPIEFIHEFNSSRKKMTTIVQTNGVHRAYSKGAPDFMLALSTKYMDKDGNVSELTEEIREKLFTKIAQFADGSLRTLLICYRDMEGEPNEQWSDAAFVENNFTVIGLVGIMDPLRPEVKKAIEDCKVARVTVRMVTGDYINTAKAIATQCGILTPDGIAMEGKEFSSKSKTELLEIAPKLQVMARSSPLDKYRLVSLLMEMGEVVAVTGDGSNDSTALKKANVGLSMGKCGTELAKMASDIVILDDNFNSIVSALKWGRCVYDNVRDFLQFQLTVNFAALILSFFGSCINEESPLKTIQLLWVNLIMDSLGALALATRSPTEELLHRPPYGESDNIISNVMIRNIAMHTCYQTLVCFLVMFGAQSIFGFEHGSRDSELHNSTLTFNVFVYCQVFNLINCRVSGQDAKLCDDFFSNPYFLIIFIVIGGLQAILVEFGGSAFETVHLHWDEWITCLAFGAGSLLFGIIVRLIKVPDNTIERLEKLRADKRAEMEERYQGMTAEEQWAIVVNEKEESSDSSEKKNKDKKKKDEDDLNEALNA